MASVLRAWIPIPPSHHSKSIAEAPSEFRLCELQVPRAQEFLPSALLCHLCLIRPHPLRSYSRVRVCVHLLRTSARAFVRLLCTSMRCYVHAPPSEPFKGRVRGCTSACVCAPVGVRACVRASAPVGVRACVRACASCASLHAHTTLGGHAWLQHPLHV